MHRWDVSIARKYPNHIFVFGDNNIGKGAGGQAIIRYEPNSMGIPTKKYPSFAQDSFYTDAEYSENCIKISEAVEKIIQIAQNGTIVGIVLPTDGLGTGLSQLPLRAPRTFEFLNNEISRLKATFIKSRSKE